MKFPKDAPIEAKLLSREKVQWATYLPGSGKHLSVDAIVALIETDGQQVAIKGFAFLVPEMAVLPINSVVRFTVDADGLVKSMELVKAPDAPSAADSSHDYT